MKGATRVNFLQTDERFFTLFAEQLAAANPTLQAFAMEVEVVESLEEKKEVSKEVEKAFQTTKTRKIRQMLGELFKEHNIDFYTIPGKGDHTKLFVNGQMIVLPEHAEWKPGTKKNIEKGIQEALEVKSHI